jgi:hypothetical protein
MDIPQSVLASLTDQDKQEYEIWQELLNSRGFLLLTEFLKDGAESTKAVIDNANNWDAYVFARGQRDGLDRVLNLQAILDAKIESIAEELDELDPEDESTYDELTVNLQLDTE